MLFILKNRYIYLYRYTLEWAQGGKLKNNLPHTNQKWTKKNQNWKNKSTDFLVKRGIHTKLRVI